MKVLRFSATWCAPCKMLESTLQGEDIGVPVEKIDIDEQQELAQKYDIRGVPTMVLVDDSDKEVSRISGMQMLNRIKEWVASNK